MQSLIECISAFIACVGFSFIFRIHHNLRFAFIGSLGGALGWFIYLACNPLNNELLSYFMAMTIVSLFAEIAARIYKAPATIFLIIGCFPLVPGKGIYLTMLHCIQGNNLLFLNNFIHTIAISATLSTAILVVSTIFKVIKRIYKPKVRSNI